MFGKDIHRHAQEFARAIRNGQYEESAEGIVFPNQKVRFHGVVEHSVNRADVKVDPNIMPTQALTYLLSAGVNNGTQQPTFYIALVGTNTTPLSTLTAANFDSTMTEFTNYDEATRVEWVDSAAAAGSSSNTASPGLFTISTGGGNVYGAALLSASAKESTSGVILACSLFAGVRALLAADELSIKYTVSATST